MNDEISISLPKDKEDLKSQIKSLRDLLFWKEIIYHIPVENDEQRRLKEKLCIYIEDVVRNRVYPLEFYLPEECNVSDKQKNDFSLKSGGIGQGPLKQNRLKELAQKIYDETI